MANDLTTMTPEELRELISQAKTRLKEVELPRKRWFVQLTGVQEQMALRDIVVEAATADAALAAVMASRDDLGRESDKWLCMDDEVDEVDAEVDPEEADAEPDYRVGPDGRLETLE
jgi:hypothetical protein